MKPLYILLSGKFESLLGKELNTEIMSMSEIKALAEKGRISTKKNGAQRTHGKSGLAEQSTADMTEPNLNNVQHVFKKSSL